MLGIEIVCIGKLSESFYREGCAEYLKRLGAYAKVTVTELAETRLVHDSDAGRLQVIEQESARILVRLAKKRAMVAALCVEGTPFTSGQLAQTLAQAAQNNPQIAFVVGGSLGLSQELKARADLRLSLSAMTLPHQMARLVLLEQLYRACGINAGSAYHK